MPGIIAGRHCSAARTENESSRDAMSRLVISSRFAVDLD
jgi:hypothetical protein